MSNSFVHDPDAVLPYGIDWSSWLADGDSIDTSTWTVPAGLAKGGEDLTGGQATVWLSGGTAGESYLVTNHVVTTDGMEDDRSIRIFVRQR